MAHVNTLYECKAGADLAYTYEPSFASVLRIESVFWSRNDDTNIDIEFSITLRGRTVVLDLFETSDLTSYVFPNVRLPHPLVLPIGTAINFRTTGIIPADTHGVMITLSNI